MDENFDFSNRNLWQNGDRIHAKKYLSDERRVMRSDVTEVKFLNLIKSASNGEFHWIFCQLFIQNVRFKSTQSS